MLILLTLLLQISCKKEALLPNPDLDQITTSCGSIPSGYQIVDLVSDSTDLDNDKVFKILFHYAQAIRIMANDATFSNIMSAAILADTSKLSTSIHLIASNNPNFKSQLNLLLRQSIINNNIYPLGVNPQLSILLNQPNWDADSYLSNILNYKGVPHSPNITTVRKIPAGPISNPVVGLGFDLNDCDEIPGWLGNSEIAISETMAQSLNNTVLIVGPGEIIQSPVTNKSHHIEVDAVDSKTINGINLRQTIKVVINPWGFKNGSRFEKNGKSEVRGKIVFSEYPNNPSNYEDEQNLHKNAFKNNSTFTTLWKLGTSIWPGEEGKVIRFGVFEYDWFSSLKTIPNDGSYEPEVNLDGRRTFTNDYYHGDAGIFGASGLFGFFPTIGSTFIVNNSKCMLTYTRVP